MPSTSEEAEMPERTGDQLFSEKIAPYLRVVLIIQVSLTVTVLLLCLLSFPVMLRLYEDLHQEDLIQRQQLQSLEKDITTIQLQKVDKSTELELRGEIVELQRELNMVESSQGRKQ